MPKRFDLDQPNVLLYHSIIIINCIGSNIYSVMYLVANDITVLLNHEKHPGLMLEFVVMLYFAAACNYCNGHVGEGHV